MSSATCRSLTTQSNFGGSSARRYQTEESEEKNYWGNSSDLDGKLLLCLDRKRQDSSLVRSPKEGVMSKWHSFVFILVGLALGGAGCYVDTYRYGSIWFRPGFPFYAGYPLRTSAMLCCDTMGCHDADLDPGPYGLCRGLHATYRWDPYRSTWDPGLPPFGVLPHYHQPRVPCWQRHY